METPFSLKPFASFDIKNSEPTFHPYIPYKPAHPYKKMSAFSQIIHKQNADSTDLYQFVLENDGSNLFEFYRLVFNQEFTAQNITATAIKQLLYTLATKNKDSNPILNTKYKFKWLNETLSNMFLNDEARAVVLNKFSMAQRTYNLINRMVYRYKFRHASMKVQYDLCMEPISKSQRNVITIIHEDQKYLFTTSDLIKMVESSLANSPYFFSAPLIIKNPYTNLPFQKSHLYNIYFFVRERVIHIPKLFHAYFMSNFNLKHFRDTNQTLIQREHTRQYVKNGDEDCLHEDIMTMLSAIKYRGHITIDPSFPKGKLVEVMRPYLELYYIYITSFDFSARNKAKDELTLRLTAFYKYNYLFGRKLYKVKNENGKRTRSVVFCDQHLPYKKPATFANYETSHLEIIESRPNYVTRSLEREPSPDPNVVQFQNLVFRFRSHEHAHQHEHVHHELTPSTEDDHEDEDEDDEVENDENMNVSLANIVNIPFNIGITHTDDLEDDIEDEDSDTDSFEDESDEGNYDP
jgi:hypothetical protein